MKGVMIRYVDMLLISGAEAQQRRLKHSIPIYKLALYISSECISPASNYDISHRQENARKPWSCLRLTPNCYSYCLKIFYSSTMAEIDPTMKFTLPFQLTKKLHRSVYPYISAANTSNSQAGKIIVITGGGTGISVTWLMRSGNQHEGAASDCIQLHQKPGRSVGSGGDCRQCQLRAG